MSSWLLHPMMATENSILPPDAKVPVDWRIVNPGYFKTMSISCCRAQRRAASWN